MFYLVCKDIDQRTQLIESLRAQDIHPVFHYISLHSSPYFINAHDHRELHQSDRFTDCLVRLPMFYELEARNVTDKLLAYADI